MGSSSSTVIADSPYGITVIASCKADCGHAEAEVQYQVQLRMPLPTKESASADDVM